jgi:hypothetical protein
MTNISCRADASPTFARDWAMFRCTKAESGEGAGDIDNSFGNKFSRSERDNAAP